MSIAQLLGYINFAQYTLEKRMAQNSEAVYNLLNQLLKHTLLRKTNIKRWYETCTPGTDKADFTVMPWD